MLFILVFNTNGLSYNYNNYSKPEDLLKWYSPTGEKPGTFYEYITKNPYKETKFISTTDKFDEKINYNITFSILVNDMIYDRIGIGEG